MQKDNFIPIYQYCKNHNVSKQNVYRWIRENKINKEDILIEERIVKRILVKNDSKPQLKR